MKVQQGLAETIERKNESFFQLGMVLTARKRRKTETCTDPPLEKVKERGGRS